MKKIYETLNEFLPIDFQNKEICYYKKFNIFLKQEYTDNVGNCYYSFIRVSASICTIYDIEFSKSKNKFFLNGINIYNNINNEVKNIASKLVDRQYYSDATNKILVNKLLTEKIVTEAKKGNITIDESMLKKTVSTLVAETFNNQIETLNSISLKKLLK